MKYSVQNINSMLEGVSGGDRIVSYFSGSSYILLVKQRATAGVPVGQC